MKLKYFLRGFGIGIIFTAVILMISNGVSDKQEMTDGQIVKRAKELGMIMETDELKESLDNLMNPTKEPEVSKKPSESPKPTEKKTEKKTETDKETKTKASAEPTPTKAADQNNDVKEYVKFSVQPGMSSGQIADYLKSIGLVDNAEKFDDYLCDNGYADRIVTGAFELSSKPTYEQIAKKITRSN